MKIKFLLPALIGLLSIQIVLADDKPGARVDVTFVEPENFSDVKDDYMGSDRGREYVLELLKEHFVATAPKFLAEGQRLEIRVTDVDLAGDFEPWRGMRFDDVRVVREIYPPRIQLEFRLLDAAGKVVAEGKRRLQDMAFMMTLSLPTNDPFRHEKGMISEWLRQEFKRQP